ncbi:MAG: DUF190 domain-containing protein [Bacteroidota bacterium]|nr:DUF190 domain-containing protein [Bacteroidota bacterium]
MLQAQIFVEKDELHDMKPLYEFIMQFLFNLQLKGATVYQAKSGFKENQKLYKPDELFSFDEIPMMITFIDEEDKVKHALTELRKLTKEGFIVTHKVEYWQ